MKIDTFDPLAQRNKSKLWPNLAILLGIYALYGVLFTILDIAWCLKFDKYEVSLSAQMRQLIGSNGPWVHCMIACNCQIGTSYNLHLRQSSTLQT